MTLLGDSAHATYPELASGGGMAIEDAVVLAHKIKEHGGDYQAAFKGYQQERYIRTAYVQHFARVYSDTYFASGIASELRNFLLSKATTEDIYRWYSYLYNGVELQSL